MTGDADNGFGQQATGFCITGIFLPDMNAVTAQLGGQVGPVVQDKGGAVGLHDGAQGVHRAADLVIADMLQAQLE